METHKKKHNIILKTSIMAIMMLCFVAVAMAAVSPSLVTTTWTNAKVNVSLTTGDNVTYVTVYASSPSTANSSTSRVFNITNSTATNFMFGYANFTLSNAQVLEDSNDYTVTFKTTGTTTGSDGKTGTSSTGVIVGRTTPTAPSAMSPTTTQTSSTVAFSATVVDATTTGCYLMFDGNNPASYSPVMTHSGTSCTATLTNVPNGVYNYYVQARDGVDEVNSAITELQVNVPSSYNKRAAVAAIASGQATTTQNGLSIIPSGETTKSIVSKETQGKELAKTGGGLVIGAIVGTTILPGIGTGVGALIGGAVGLWF